jgi:hypothetical protein
MGSGASQARRCSNRRAGPRSWSKEVCHGLRVLHEAGVEPRQHLVPLALPFGEVMREAEAALGNVGAGLLQGQGEPAQFFGQGSCRGGVVGLLAPFRIRARQQEVGSGLGREHVQRQRRNAAAPIAG